MTMMTGQQYRESLRRLKPEIYYMGEKIDNVADHPAFFWGDVTTEKYPWIKVEVIPEGESQTPASAGGAP